MNEKFSFIQIQIQAWTLVQYVEEVERQTKQRAAKLSLISLNIQQTITDMTTMIVDRALQKIYKCLEVEEDKRAFSDESEFLIHNLTNLYKNYEYLS